MKTILTILSLALACFLLTTQAHATSEEEAALKQSMLERVDAVDDLKLAGKVGENNEGRLEQRAALTPAESKLLREENSNRRALYAILAKRLNLTIRVVGQGRAEGLRKKSAKGVWLQDPDGTWYRQS